MIRYIRFLLSIILGFGSFALYAGDDPCNATNLSTSSTEFLIFDNSGNSDSGIEAPPLGGYLGSDIWFSFTMPASELSLLLQNAGMTDPAMAIYSGDCNDPLINYNVIDNNCDGSVDPELLISDLNTGETYFIRIWAQDGSNDGTFGIFLGTDVPTLLSFEVYDDASFQGDCIELTPEEDTMHGCAWYQLQIDFNEPFTHDMIANFGDNFFDGADGICLIYQTNGPDFCGSTGSGIGAEGINNSAIFEFDTYQNSGNPYFDPFFDHASFNVNGNMTHPASINGPVSLGNIEDGNDHTISFSWDPAGNSYDLFFDGALILSGSYDIINNCFGGNNLAYWGYTASTGGSNNNHIICPIGVEYNPATVAYEEVLICADESYNGWTESGFYIREEAIANNCIHQVHTLLTVAEESEPYTLEKYICNGETFEVEGEFFMDEGIYTINTQTTLGCDSTINLFLKVIKPTLEIVGAADFTCLTDSILLAVDFDVNYPIDELDFFWQTPNGTSQSDSIIAISPGLYSVNTFINYEDVLCLVSFEIELFIDTIPPILEEISDLTILCNTPIEDRILVAAENQGSSNLSWFFDNTLVGTDDTLSVNTEGTYTLVAQDPINGCINTTTANVILDGDIPQIEIQNDSLILNCFINEYIITPNITYQEPGTIVWENNSTIISNDASITINDPGVYLLMVTDVNGCNTMDSIIVSIDTLSPTLVIDDIVLPCDQIDTLINPITLSNNTSVLWDGPQELNNTLSPLINTAGIYTVTITNTNNFCTATGNMIVDLLGPTPELEILGNTNLNCDINTIDLNANVNQNDASLNWYNSEGVAIANTPNLSVTNSGIYIAEAISINGCQIIDSTIITIDTISPILILNDLLIPCDQTDTLLNTITLSDNTSALWDSPQEINNEFTPLISTPGAYSVTITDNTNLCTASGNMLIDFLGATPEVEITGNDVLNCNIINTEINANTNQDNASINWYSSDGTLIAADTGILIVNTEDIYTVEIISATGCSTTDSIEIIENIIFPIITLDTDTIDCDNLQATIEADITNGTIDNWETPADNNTTTSSITSDLAGIYTLSAINIETGCITTESIEVIDLSNPPTYTFESNSISCNDPNVILNLDITSVYQSLTWTYPDASTSNELSPEINIGGIYNLHIEVEGSCDLDTIIVIEIDTISPSYELDYGIIDCTTNNTFLNLTNVNNIESIVILSPTNEVFNNLENTVTQGGLYSISTIGSNGCTTNSFVEITSLLSDPEVTIEQDTLVSCDDPIATITALSNNTNLTYAWTDEEANPIGNNSTLDINNGGVYLLEIVDENGCNNTYSVTIEEQLELPQFNLSADSLSCDITTATILLESENILSDIVWSDMNGTINTEDQLVVDQIGWYYTEVSNQYGCVSSDSILIVENIDVPLLDLISADSVLLFPNEVSNISINELSSGNINYQWMPIEGLSCSDCLEPTITEFVHDNYQLIVTNEYGCTSTLAIHVRIKKITQVTIPNIFSPSSKDSSNDHFTLYGNENVELINEMYVYDRWGNLVYSNMNFAPNDPYLGWDGSYKGSSVVNGVYVYLFKVTTNDDEVLTFTGDITKI